MLEREVKNISEYYGIRNLSLKEEANLPRYERLTRNNKISIVNSCESMKKILDSIEGRARKIPERNDYEHCVMVLEYAKLMSKAWDELQKVYLYKRS